MRKSIFLILSVVVLGLVLWLREQKDALPFVVPPDAGPVLYAASFNDGLFADDWSQQDRRGGVIEVSNDVLLVSLGEFVPGGELLRSTIQYRFSDFDFRAQVAAVDGPMNNGFGLVFRQLNADTYYLFYISSDGYYSVWRVVNGVRFALSTWIPSPLVNQGVEGQTNDLRVVAQGDTFQFFLNGEPLMLCVPDAPGAESTYVEIGGQCVDGQMLNSVTDATIPAGYLGVAVETLMDGGIAVQFDNVVVLPPD